MISLCRHSRTFGAPFRALGFSLLLLLSIVSVSQAQTPEEVESAQIEEEASQAIDVPPIDTPFSPSISQESVEKLSRALVALVEQLQVNSSAGSSLDKILGLVIPVVAAFLGALLTFLATQFTERRNWLRSQRDALRDKQFSSIAGAAKKIGEIVSSAHGIRTTLKGLGEISTASSVEAQAALMELGKRREIWIILVEDSIAVMTLVLVELRLVDVPSDISTHVERYIDHLKLILKNVRGLSKVFNAEKIHELERLVGEMDNKAEEFVNTAKTFHRGGHE